MAIPLDQFTRQLAESGLMPADELAALLDGLPPESKADSEHLARELVRRKKLTAFQAQQLYQGKGKHLVLGNYVVLDKLGQGGMGLVLKAEHRRMKRFVALKVLSPAVTKTPEALRRFQREVEAAAKLTHPNIVTAYDADEAGGTHFLVLEYIDGQDLAALVKEKGPLPVEHALTCLLQAARGLDYAHSRGVVHRDIKPSNLLLDRDGTIKILDMGLARLDTAGPQQDQLTGSGQIMGTVDFMAPEQAINTRHADGRADIYSLGATLWYLLAGRTLYEGETAVERLMAHQTRPIPSLCAACPSASPALDAVFARIVAKTPAERYQTMAAVIAALEGCRAGEGSAPSVAPARGEVSHLSDFLRGMGATPTPDVATIVAPANVAPTPAVEATLSLASAQVDTDPRTEQSLPGSLLGIVTASSRPMGQPKARTAWWQKVSIPPHRRMPLLAVCAVMAAALLLAGIVLFWPDNQGTLPRADVAADEATGSRWQSWPADAPPPAIAPFDAAQAKAHQEAWADYLGVPVEYENSIGMKFVLIPPGEFAMGSTSEEIEAELVVAGEDDYWMEYVRSEAPQHKVILVQPVYLGLHEVTQAQYEQVMGQNPSHFAATGPGKDAVVDLDTSTHPVETVSWNNAAEFCGKLSEKERLKPFYFPRGEAATLLEGDGYRLPTEAQWEFACRAGTTTKYSTGDRDEVLPQVGWFNVTSHSRTHALGELKVNPFGLYDIHGNVWEWVQDCWESNYYTQFQKKPALDPSGPSSAGSRRVFRGGNWDNTASHCRASARFADDPPTHNSYIGFRVALSVDAVRQALASQDRVVSLIPRMSQELLADGRWEDVRIEGDIVTFDATGGSPQLWLDFLPLRGEDLTLRTKLRIASEEIPGYAKLAFISEAEPDYFLLLTNQPGSTMMWVDTSQANQRLTPAHPCPLAGQDFIEIAFVMRGGRLQIQLAGETVAEAPAPARSVRHVALAVGGWKCDLEQAEVVIHAKPAADEGAAAASPTSWHGWPADAPPPANAPFDAAQAKAHQDAWAAHLGVPVEYENSIGMKFVLIPPGEFTMGSTPEEVEEAIPFAQDREEEWIRSEAPRHKVILTQPIYLGVHEVTQAEYEMVTGTNPSYFAASGLGKDTVIGLEPSTHPVELTTWRDAAEFCMKLSEREKLKPFYSRVDENATMWEGIGYRLPTEAEWEFACRAGTTTKYWSGEEDVQLRLAAWINLNSDNRTHAVGASKASPFGLCDMHGNVWEWVQDWWEPDYYARFQEKPALDPRGSSAGSRRVVRGGAWNNSAFYCRASIRVPSNPRNSSHNNGFRVALAIDAVRSRDSSAGDANPDRAFAQWMLGHGFAGSGMLGETAIKIDSQTALPAAPFILQELHTVPAQRLPAEVLAEGLRLFRALRHFDEGYLPFADADQWAAAFADVPTTSSVNAFRSDITNDGLGHLTRLTQLKYLNLDRCENVTADGLLALSACLRLATLELDGNALEAGKYPLPVLQRLQNALSKCKIQQAGGTPIPGLMPPSAAGGAPPAVLRPADGPLEVLPIIDLTADVPENGGAWTRDGQTLRSPEQEFARVAIPVEPRGDYELTCEFARTAGSGPVSIFLPVGSRHVQCVFDGWEGIGLSGLQAVEGRDKPDTLKGEGRFAFSLENGRRYAFTIRVKSTGANATIDVELDGANFFYWPGRIDSLSLIDERFALPAPGLLGIGAWDSVVEFHSVKLRMLSGDAELNRAADAVPQ